MSICFPTNTFSSMFIAVVIGFVLVYFIQRQEIQNITLPTKTEYITKPQYIPIPTPVSNPSIVVSADNLVDTSRGPERPYISNYDTTAYHEIGYIQDTQNIKLRMRLYGRRKYARSDKFEYYTLDDNGIKIVVNTKNNKELYENDTVQVTGFLNPFVVHIYDVSGPRYQA